MAPYRWLKQKADFHQYVNFSQHVLGYMVSEQNDNWVHLSVNAFLILESHVSEINQPFDTCLLKVRQSSVYLINNHNLAGTHLSPAVKIHSILQLAQPLQTVSRHLIFESIRFKTPKRIDWYSQSIACFYWHTWRYLLNVICVYNSMILWKIP